MDAENKDQLLRLMRYNSTFTEGMTSLEDYIKHMKEGQNKIYFVTGATKEHCLNNPFMEAFKGTDIPVLILNNNIDEICF